MKSDIQLLDCTLRDGAYIVDGQFGESVIKGIVGKLQLAGVEVVECGWLKDKEYKDGSTYYHTPNDMLKYLENKNEDTTYVAMIDWDRYNLANLPQCDGKTIDAIRVVFPNEKFREGIAVGKQISEKGYKVYYQAANTLEYSDDDLRELAKVVNDAKPIGVSVVDTFGSMFEDDLERIVNILNEEVDRDIVLGFHSHNNQQMAFANSMHFIKILRNSGRKTMVDSSLCGMGRGAGNATTELMANFLNLKCKHNYDLDAIMDAIDMYILRLQERYAWGYSTPYYIAGMYCCHVNNITYLQKNHRINTHDMRNIIEAIPARDRKKYDYDLLEQKYIENQDRKIDDKDAVAFLRDELGISRGECKKILLIAPGRSSLIEREKIKEFIKREKPVVIAVNALLQDYKYDYLFITNSIRYDYAKTTYPEQFNAITKIVLSNIKNMAEDKEYILNYNRAIKRGWTCFDNSVICALRLMERLRAGDIYLAGFDGFKNNHNENYAEDSLATLKPINRWDRMNEEIKQMLNDVRECSKYINIHFVTDSIYD